MEATASTTHRFTRVQYEQMIEAGIFGEDDRVELIEGKIRPMGPQNRPHKIAVTKGLQALMRICPDGHFVCSQIPIALGRDSEPEPDLAIVQGDPDDLDGTEGDAVRLIVEVADSSLEYDRGAKRRLYARHGVSEYWIVNLRDGQVEVFRAPQVDDYATKDTHVEGSITPSVALDRSVSVLDLLP